MPKTHDAALDAFMARKAQINPALGRICGANDDHFTVNPEDVNVGHVTAVAGHAALLKRITVGLHLSRGQKRSGRRDRDV